jgi:hypothetical protein
MQKRAAMKVTPRLFPLRWIALGPIIVLVSCGGSSNAPPVARALMASMEEDTVYQGSIEASDPDGDPLTFSVSTNPLNGTATIDAHTGSFTYTPNPDYFGSDSFAVSVQATGGVASAGVVLDIRNVPDPPRVQPIADHQNSADSRITSIPIDATDPDKGSLIIGASSSDAAVATAAYNQGTNTVDVTQSGTGTATIAVSIANSSFTTQQTFNFTVAEVTRSADLSPAIVSSSAVQLKNNAPTQVQLRLIHNGFQANASISDMLGQIQSPSNPLPPEQFAKALWRYVRDNTIHRGLPNANGWVYAPWVTMRSFGFAICSHVALTYATLARAANYQARVWELNGHTVPEILAGGRWEMYDPDLGVYYLNRSGQVAGVQELADDPSLISSPVYMGMPMWPHPYSSVVADIYGSQYDNFLEPDWLYDAAAYDSAPPVVMPPGSTLTYPGHWTSAPMQADGITPIAEYKQAALDLALGWTGTIQPPWALADIQGSGTVLIDGVAYAVGSADLSALIRNTTTPIAAVQVTVNDGIRFVYWCSLARMYMTAQTQIQVQSVDAWAIDAAITVLPNDLAAAGTSASVKARMIEP